MENDSPYKTDSSALLGCGGCIAGLEIGDTGKQICTVMQVHQQILEA